SSIRRNTRSKRDWSSDVCSSDLSLTEETEEFEYASTADEDRDDAQLAFQIGGAAEEWTFCLDDVSLLSGVEPPVYEPDTGPTVRVNQVGHLPDGPKNATVVTEADNPLPWELTDRSEEHTSELQSRFDIVCRLLLEKK